MANENGADTEARIVSYRPDLQPHFERLNREWIERHFTVEDADLRELRDPETVFLAPGGQIFFVETADGSIVGTLAIAPDAQRPGEWHLSKMAVAPDARGRGCGSLLMRAALDFARTSGATAVTLVSNTRLAPAIRLYEKHGFRAVPLDPDEQYARADIKMRRDLGA